jgi:hypothetical protein
MNTPSTIEQLMLKKQQEREEKAKSNFFANKTVFRKDSEQPLLSEKVCRGPRKKITVRSYNGYQNTFYFMLDLFDTFKLLLYDETLEACVATEKRNSLIELYKNKCNFSRRTTALHDDDEIWTILERKFRRDYRKLYKAKNG